ncbi:MAG: cell division ATP-binding protein FtsE [Coxiellaceae bacterium]|nr:cell division ATP-binding protein FtsE [Coxiellaceae bacterium]
MIRFINVTKTYNGHHALSNINLHIEPAEMCFLTGHSGAGKTTLLKLIMMMESPSRGQLILNGQNLNQISKRHIPGLRRQIGMIFQNPQLLPNRSIYNNVALPLHIARFKPKEIGRRVRAALDKVGLLHKEKHYPAELSAGEQQRVGIARAVITKPTILLADEPTGNLDPSLAKEIMDLFAAFNAVGVTVMIASHDLGLISRMDKRIVTLDQGQIVSKEREYA